MRPIIVVALVMATSIISFSKAAQNLQGEGQPSTNSTYKAYIRRFCAFMGFGIYADETGHFIYNSSILFKDTALWFQNKILQNAGISLKQQYGIEIEGGFKQQQLNARLDSKLKEFGTQPFKSYLKKAWRLRQELTSISNELLLPEQQQALAKKILKLLGHLYDQTYGVYVKQSEPDKFIILLGDSIHRNGLTEQFDARREVFGMKPLEKMPETFRYFHSKAKKISSQLDQDGVIEAIFEVIDSSYENSKFFVEVGGGSKVDNTAYLREQKGWTGFLFNSGTYFMGETDYNVTDEYVGPEEAIPIFQKYKISQQFDFLSIDVDSRDCWIMDAVLQKYRPAVVSVEFNCNFGVDVSVAIPRMSSAIWGQQNHYYDKYYGCSARAAADMAEKHGYGYVWHQPLTDIFFVRKQLLPSNLPPVDLKSTFDAVPLHKFDGKFKQYVDLGRQKGSDETYQIKNEIYSQTDRATIQELDVEAPAQTHRKSKAMNEEGEEPGEWGNYILGYIAGALSILTLFFMKSYWQKHRGQPVNEQQQIVSNRKL